MLKRILAATQILEQVTETTVLEAITIAVVIGWLIYAAVMSDHRRNAIDLKMPFNEYWWCIRNRVCPLHLAVLDQAGKCLPCVQAERNAEQAKANEFFNKLAKMKEKYASKNND